MNVICWSGGHDSTLMMHYLLYQQKDLHPYLVVFADSTITFPETHTYIHDIVQDFGIQTHFRTLKPQQTFYERLLRYQFWPSIRALWCRKTLKLQVLKQFYNSLPDPLTEYVGISRADSGHRNQLYQEPKLVRKWGRKLVKCEYPLLKWSDAQKEAYFRKEQIPRNPIYDTMGVSGCYFCPFYHEKDYSKLQRFHPELFCLLLSCEQLIGKRALPDFWLKDVGFNNAPDVTDFQMQTMKDFNKGLLKLPRGS